MIDVLVIGGGIHGAGVAQAAAAAGYSVLLLEQKEPAYGTSSKSSKLIHGGLRYLETRQFSLVRECLVERQILLNNAPHLVKLKKFYIPIYKQTSRRPLSIRVGLSIYALLSGLSKSGRFNSIPRSAWNKLDGLSTNQLQSVFQYWDAQTNDKLLTQAVIKSAEDLGAVIELSAEFKNAWSTKQGWHVLYDFAGVAREVDCRCVINTAGPWVNQVLARFQEKIKNLPVDLVQGTHIVLPGATEQGIYYVEAPADKRAVFVMPWGKNTMVGTTEKQYQGDPANVYATEQEIKYLLDTAGHYFSKYQRVVESDIVSKFAGLRVLPRAEGAAFSRPRETTIYEDAANAKGVFTIYGGKLTAYRATAELVVKKLMTRLPQRKVKADTKVLKLVDI